MREAGPGTHVARPGRAEPRTSTRMPMWRRKTARALQQPQPAATAHAGDTLGASTPAGYAPGPSSTTSAGTDGERRTPRPSLRRLAAAAAAAADRESSAAAPTRLVRTGCCCCCPRCCPGRHPFLDETSQQRRWVNGRDCDTRVLHETTGMLTTL